MSEEEKTYKYYKTTEMSAYYRKHENGKVDFLETDGTWGPSPDWNDDDVRSLKEGNLKEVSKDQIDDVRRTRKTG